VRIRVDKIDKEAVTYTPINDLKEGNLFLWQNMVYICVGHDESTKLVMILGCPHTYRLNGMQEVARFDFVKLVACKFVGWNN
jgi:hypothetical protein